MLKTISIPSDDLPCSQVVLTEKGRGSNKYLTWESGFQFQEMPKSYRPDIKRYNEDGLLMVTLSETDIHEYAAQALKELQHAENALKRAKDRADALRMFARELYAAPTLKAVGDE